MLRRLRKGQSTAEYAIVIGVVIAAAVAMQVYVKRGLQAKIKAAVNHTEGGYGMGNAAKQYEPYYLSQQVTSDTSAQERAETQTGGGVVRTTDSNVTTRTGHVTTNSTDIAD